jgi:hypothetical protein
MKRAAGGRKDAPHIELIEALLEETDEPDG